MNLLAEIVARADSHPYGLTGVVYDHPALVGIRGDIARAERVYQSWCAYRRRESIRRLRRLVERAKK